MPRNPSSQRTAGKQNRFRKGRKLPLGIMLGLLLLVSFGVDIHNATQGGAIDLRNRVTGVRVLLHGIDPYHYKWVRSDPATYCDPFNNPKLPVSKTTATPALLLVEAPVAWLPYRWAQFSWLLLQWALLLGTAWLWWREAATPWTRTLIALFVVGFTYTAAWRLHAERGQAYVLLLFLFAAWLRATLRPAGGNFWPGFLAGFLITLRPPFLLLLPFLAIHRRPQLPGAAVGLVLGIVLPMLFLGSCWHDYFSGMQEQVEIYRADSNPHYSQAYPPEIEGIPTDTLAAYVPISFADYSLHGLLRWLSFTSLDEGPVLGFALIPFAFWVWFSRAARMENLLPALAAWFFLIDLFLPAYRNTYNDVLILNVFAVAVLASRRLPWSAWLCLLALPCGWAVYLLSPVDPGWINLPSLLCTIAAILTVYEFTFRAENGRVEAAC